MKRELLLITVGRHTYEVCDVIDPGRPCADCAGFGNMGLCRRFPPCDGGVYYRRLTNYEMRQLRREGLRRGRL
jgi:hypothetical protein